MKLTNIIPLKIDILFALLLFVAPGYLHAENCPDNVISYWKLDETTANFYEDSIGSHDGACAGDCPTNQNGGVVNKTKLFDGNLDGINVPAAADFDWSANASFSVEMWVKRTTLTLHGNGEVVIGRIDPDSSLEWRVEIREVTGEGHRAAFKLVDTAGTGAAESLVAVGSKPISTNRWHHIVAIRDAAANTNVLYVDGQLDAQTQSLQYSAGFGSDSANLNIGWIDGTVARPLSGSVDEVAVYNRVLTEQEILTHYYLAKGYCDELDSAIRITPMGDSITKDRLGVGDTRPDAERDGYRETLYDNLRQDNFWFDYIGSEGDHNDGAFEDVDHTGWGGIRTSHLLDMLPDGIFPSPDGGTENLGISGSYLENYPTDIILLHIGTNDVGAQINGTLGAPFPSGPIDNLTDILQAIDDFDERITVLLARIVSRTDDPDAPANIKTYNDALEIMANNRTDAGDKIIVVDMEDGANLNYPGDLRDGIHPTPTGYGKMGDHWSQVLDTILPAFTAPNITSSPDLSANQGQLYSYQVVSDGTGTLTYSFVGTQPQGMTINAQGLIEWTPAAAGSFDVTVRVTNPMPFGQTGADEQPFTIEVDENQLPVGVNDSYSVTRGTTLNRTAAQGVLANDSDPDSGDTLTAVQLQAPAHGSLTLNTDGSFIYVHDGSQEATDTFTYAASDGKGQSGAVTVSLNIEDGVITPVSGDGGGGGGGGGCFISVTNNSESHGHGRKMTMLGVLALLGILVICLPAAFQQRRHSVIGN